MDGISTILKDRESRYGDFPSQATITQNIKREMRRSPNWHHLSEDKKEALEMIASKMGRILNGDPEYPDSWRDISGYAELVTETLQEDDDSNMLNHYCPALKASVRVENGLHCNTCNKVVV